MELTKFHSTTVYQGFYSVYYSQSSRSIDFFLNLFFELFATKEALHLHMPTHKVLKKSQSSCSGCGKTGFTKAKSLKDHWRFCPKNPDRVGPFPCPVPGCHRGTDKPFERTRNLNQHLRVAHGHDPKHTRP